LFLRVKCRANADGIAADTGGADVGHVSATVDLLGGAAAAAAGGGAVTRRHSCCSAKRLQRQLQAAHLHTDTCR